MNEPPRIPTPPPAPVSGPGAPAAASIKITLEETKGVFGLKSVTFLLDGQPLQPVPMGGAGVFGVSPGPHTIQAVLKACSMATFFITITRRSAVLTVNVAPNAQAAVAARYSRAWGKFEVHAV